MVGRDPPRGYAMPGESSRDIENREYKRTDLAALLYLEGLQRRSRTSAVLEGKGRDGREDLVGSRRTATSRVEEVWEDIVGYGRELAPVDASVTDTAALKMDVTGLAVEDPWPEAADCVERVTFNERVG